jgi:hypothetical protein
VLDEKCLAKRERTLHILPGKVTEVNRSSSTPTSTTNSIGHDTNSGHQATKS